MGSGILVDFPPSNPNECSLIDAEILRDRQCESWELSLPRILEILKS